MRKFKYLISCILAIFSFFICDNIYAEYTLEGKASMKVGESKTIEIGSVYQRNLSLPGVTVYSYRWYTTDKNIQILSNNKNYAVIKGLSPTTKAIVYYDCTFDWDGFYRYFDFYFEITVSENVVKVSNIVMANQKTMDVGTSTRLATQVYPINATNKKLLWTSNNYNVAHVNDDGLVTALSPGTAYVTCVADDGGGAYASCKVDVAAIMPSSLSLSQEEMELTEGATRQLSVVFTPANTTYKNLLWTSDNTSVATVDSNGNVTAVGIGVCNITATTTDGSNLSVSCKLKVTTSTKPDDNPGDDDNADGNDNPDDNAGDNETGAELVYSMRQLPLCPAEYDPTTFEHIFPTSAITIRLKNGERFCLPRDSADYSSCSIYFDKPIEVDGLFLEGCRDIFIEEIDYVKNVHFESQKLEIPVGTQTFTTNAIGKHSGLLSLINESGQDIELTINGVVYCFMGFNPSSNISLYYKDNCFDPGFTLYSVDPETGMDMIKQIGGISYSGNLSHIISPITTARIHFDYSLKEIGGDMWKSKSDKNIYVAEFTDPVPSNVFKWRYTTANGEIKYQNIIPNSLNSVLSINEPVDECSIVYETGTNDNYIRTLNIRSVTLKTGENSVSSLKGDVNDDKKIDISDIVAIINIIAGK